MINLDRLKNMSIQEWGEFFSAINICPYIFGSNRRGKYKTCPYPNKGLFECAECWVEWLEKPMKVR